MAFAGRAMSWEKRGKYSKVIADLEAAYLIAPDFLGLNMELARHLSTCPNVNYRDGQRAVKFATRACELTDWKHYAPLQSLAIGYAECGDYANAIVALEKSIRAAPPESQVALLSRLRSCRAGKRYTEPTPVVSQE